MTALAYAQPFTIDSNLVDGATEVYITSCIFYNKKKPSYSSGASGSQSLFVSTAIIEADDQGKPITSSIDVRKTATASFGTIFPSIDATIETVFRFANPVLVKTNKKNFILILPLDSGYEFWKATINETDLADQTLIRDINLTNSGYLYELTSDFSSVKPLVGTAFKFKVKVARFYNDGVPVDPDIGTYDYNSDKLELVVFDNTTETFHPGEKVYKKITPSGNATVIAGSYNVTLGSNALFSTYYTNNAEPMYIVVDNGTYRNVRQILSFNGSVAETIYPFSFTNAEAYYYAGMPIAEIQGVTAQSQNGVNKTLILTGSTANSTMFFSNGDSLITEDTGIEITNCYFENAQVHSAFPNFDINIPPGTSYLLDDNFNYIQNSSGSAEVSPHSDVLELDKLMKLGSPPTLIMSRSNEVQLTNSTSITNSYNSVINMSIFSKNDFMIPMASDSTLHVTFNRFIINNDYTNEHTSYGNAYSKEVTQKVTLNKDQYAEDMLVFLQGYRPFGSDFKVFAKFFNSADGDYFDDKDWTMLEIRNNANVYSSFSNTNDIIEYSYGLTYTPNSAFTCNSTATLASGDANVIAASDAFMNISTGDLVKIYNPLFADTNFMVTSVVNAVSNTLIVIDSPTSNASMLGAGLLVDKIAYPYQAFLNIQNGNALRYYNLDNAIVDLYDTFAIKVVFLSDSSAKIPFFDSVSAVGLSA